MICRAHAAGSASLSVAAVLERFHESFLERYGAMLSWEQRKALQSILTCRSEAMGGKRYYCGSCQRDHFAWHSCNHRLCPRCGASDTAQWVAERLAARLPVPHFMVTFTLPAAFRTLCHHDAARFYRLFFASASRSLKDVLGRARHLGAPGGFFGMFQSWTQEMRLHPHIHFVVPAVGLTAKGDLTHLQNPKWLARGDVFAARLRILLLSKIEQAGLMESAQVKALWSIKWNCDVEDFGDGENALKYLGRYVCKGPITDSRIVSVSDAGVQIRVKDRTTQQTHCVTIEGVEFVRRYLQHALPRGFHRIRYFGFMHARGKARLAVVRAQLGLGDDVPASSESDDHAAGSPDGAMCCPRCGEQMLLIGHQSRAPPEKRALAKIWKRQRRGV